MAESLHPAVAPAWPEWATTEDGDRVWVRLDRAHVADQVASPAVEHGYCLERVGRVPMWLDLVDTEWSFDWLLRPVEADADEAVVYVEYEVVEDFPCTHCSGDGDCMDGSDPLGDCPDEPHRCHACRGTGRRADQVIF